MRPPMQIDSDYMHSVQPVAEPAVVLLAVQHTEPVAALKVQKDCPDMTG